MAAPGPSSRLMRGTRNSTLSKPAISVTRSAKTTAGSAMSYAAPQTKSMRALGKENEELQLQLKEMAESIKASNEAKCLIRTSSEVRSRFRQLEKKVWIKKVEASPS